MRFMPFTELLRKSSGGSHELNGLYFGPLTFIEERPGVSLDRRELLKGHKGEFVCFLRPVFFSSLLTLLGWIK